jgi:hypothetical protein
MSGAPAEHGTGPFDDAARPLPRGASDARERTPGLGRLRSYDMRACGRGGLACDASHNTRPSMSASGGVDTFDTTACPRFRSSGASARRVARPDSCCGCGARCAARPYIRVSRCGTQGRVCGYPLGDERTRRRVSTRPREECGCRERRACVVRDPRAQPGRRESTFWPAMSLPVRPTSK